MDKQEFINYINEELVSILTRPVPPILTLENFTKLSFLMRKNSKQALIVYFRVITTKLATTIFQTKSLTSTLLIGLTSPSIALRKVTNTISNSLTNFHRMPILHNRFSSIQKRKLWNGHER